MEHLWSNGPRSDIVVDPGVRNGDVWFLPTNIVQDLTKGLKGCPKRDPKRAKNGGFQGPKPWIS